jgi:NADPH2:quinone reductase
MRQSTVAGEATPATMCAVVVTRPGGLDALEIKEIPVPVRKPGWVRIAVKAFGVNESEVTTRKGGREGGRGEAGAVGRRG